MHSCRRADIVRASLQIGQLAPSVGLNLYSYVRLNTCITSSIYYSLKNVESLLKL